MANIMHLPYEIISSILEEKELDSKDVTNFSLTHKRFYDIVKNNNILWRGKLFQTWPVLQEVCKFSYTTLQGEQRYLEVDMKAIFDINRFNEVEPCKYKQALEHRTMVLNENKKSALNAVGGSPINWNVPYLLHEILNPTDGKHSIIFERCTKLLNHCPTHEVEKLMNRILIRRSVDFVNHDDELIQLEALFVLNAVTTTMPQQRKTIISHGIIPRLISLLQSPPYITEPAVQLLTNLTEGHSTCNLILQHDPVPLLLNLIESDGYVFYMRSIIWTLLGLWQDREPPSPFNIIKRALPAINQHFTKLDSDLRADGH